MARIDPSLSESKSTELLSLYVEFIFVIKKNLIIQSTHLINDSVIIAICPSF